MRKFLLIISLVAIVAQLQAQNTTEKAPINLGHSFRENTWKYSPELSEEELYQYDRLLYMSKADWELFRTDPRYNDQRVRDIYKENKGKINLGKAQQAATQKSMTGDDCNCWVEPDNTYTTTDPNDWPNCAGGGPGVDCWIGPLNLPFDFCFFGQDFDQVVITSKGTIVFGTTGYFDWTPSEFPTPTVAGEPQYDHICGFWADADFRQTGEVKYKITDEAFYLNFIDVGYYANHGNLTNTFQIVITADNSGIIPGGNNVQLCYQDMDWAHGDVGGSGGFNGPTPAQVGADRVAGTNHVQFGRFNLNSNVYNGPYGQAAAQQDGIDWLDNKVFNFNTCVTSANIPPMGTVSAPCDTIFLCQGDIYDLGMQFLSPETGQTTTITTSQTGTGLTSSATSGNTATLTASFTASASNIGNNTVTITATDSGSPAAATTLTFIFVVQDIVPPAINISGDLSICAGGETLLSATGGFDSYSWSSGCDTQDCLVEQGGNVTVTGYTGTCASTATVVIEASDYFIPDFANGNEPLEVCPGISAEVCLAEEWESYSWMVYPGYEGTIPAGTATNQQCFQASGTYPGYYQVIVEDEFGCEGFNIQEIVQVQSFIDETNEENSGAYCDGLEPVEFIGGFSNPAEGSLIVYCLSTSANGWQGSYLSVTITHTDGTSDTYLMTGSSTFTVNNAPITLDDQIDISYVSSGLGDANNSFWVINCGGTPYQSGQGLTAGPVYSEISECSAQPLNGTWTVTGPAGWSLSTTTQYNPISGGVESPNVFTPGDYGLYTLCFSDPECNLDHCYELEYTEAPSLTMAPGLDVLLCDNQTSNVAIDVTDIGGTGDITWTGTGINVASDELSAVAGPYTGYVNTTVVATITNGCGSDSEDFIVEHQPDVPTVTLSDQFLCNDGNVTLDPVATAQDNANLDYDWSPGTASGSTLVVTASGEYCVVVSNECDASTEVCADVTLVPAATVTGLPLNILECDDDEVTLSVTVPTGYTISWDNGATTGNITVSSSGTYCYDVTDIAGCDTHTEGCTNVVISQDPSINPNNTEALLICPGECQDVSLNATGATSYSWTSSCGGLDLPSNETVSVCSAEIPLACQSAPILLTGSASNACGTLTANFVIAANACVLKIPNVFTPNNDQYNATFEIVGLENYPNTKFRVYDRWGKEMYTSDDYNNDWGPQDIAPGTYYYIIELPFGVTKEISGHFTVLQ